MKNMEVLKYSLIVEFLLEVLTKRRRQVFHKPNYRSSLSGKCCRRGYFFNKQVEYCEPVR